jgi:membrane associated rhomboid family serine protease
MQQFRQGGLNSLPMVVKNLLIINVLFFLGTFVLAYTSNINLADYLGLHYPGSRKFGIWQIVTYMFMHGGIWHIAFNMYALVLFGKVVESVWGPKRFLNYYLVTGVGAAVVQILVTYIRVTILTSGVSPEILDTIYTEGFDILLQGKNYTDPTLSLLNRDLFLLINSTTVGASGAIFGLLLAFGMMFPDAQLMLIFPPIPIKGKYIAIIALVLGVVLDFQGNTAHFAHLGGMVFGYLLIFYWKKKGTLYS